MSATLPMARKGLVPVSRSYLRGEHLMMLTTDLGFSTYTTTSPGFRICR